ncbi:hypothetical protein MN033_08805 [Bacillus nitratireducens]|uniref:hypothetical protein n=1 Tax=Bacillus nitratireducens TaxID=2026193 RepID=UPI001F5827C1|nr:hypothetical protein [Bacillus nitratireducens]UNP78265.1 hypothetical protein MN033_08805 [Bacillus nitratireducens]
MIKVEIHEEIRTRHLNYCLGKELVKTERVSLIDKLKNELRKETNKPIKKILLFLEDNFIDLITGYPDKLNELRLKIETLITQAKQNVKPLKIDGKIKKVLEAIFAEEYKQFISRYSQNKDLWSAYRFMEVLNVRICPYCNSQFTFTFNKCSGKTRPALDHFFPKAKFPFLAMSIYNLIPSCKVCNSDFKKDQFLSLNDYIHPYIEGFENVKFKRKFNDTKTSDYLSIILGEDDGFDLILDINEKNPTPFETRCKNNKDLFHLEDVYNYHKRYVQDIILKSRIYNDIYQKQLKTTYSRLFNSDEELHQILIPKDADMNSIILSKLTKDILISELYQNIK